MSIEYVIDSADSTVRSTHVGQIPVEEEIAFLETVLSDSQFQRGMHALCNLSEATIDWSLNDLDRFRSFVENRKNVMGNCKWALLSTGGITHLTARIFILLYEAFSDSIQIKLFGTKEEAEAWLFETTSREVSHIAD